MAEELWPSADPQPPPPHDGKDATRYLCVGAQIDSRFGHRVLKETLEQRYRAIAPSFGFDLASVVVSALSARRRRMQRDVALVVISGVNLILNPVGTVVTALSWLWARFVYRSTRQRWPGRDRRHALTLATLAYLLFIPILVMIGFLLSVVISARSRRWRNSQAHC